MTWLIRVLVYYYNVLFSHDDETLHGVRRPLRRTANKILELGQAYETIECESTDWRSTKAPPEIQNGGYDVTDRTVYAATSSQWLRASERPSKRPTERDSVTQCTRAPPPLGTSPTIVDRGRPERGVPRSDTNDVGARFVDWRRLPKLKKRKLRVPASAANVTALRYCHATRSEIKMRPMAPMNPSSYSSPTCRQLRFTNYNDYRTTRTRLS